ncbi:MAG: CpaD family pilus assembly lipoprotein [Erythrobacter sp.]
MPIAKHSKLAGAVALSLGLILGGCGGMPTNKSLYSTKQAVVERSNYTLDVQTSQDGLTIPEQQRLSGWFEAMDIRYGDRISVDDPLASDATKDSVAELAGRFGLLIESTAPVTSGFVQPGYARVVLTRSTASVPGCPDWSESSDMNYNNATSPGYGCATNSNIAAMVANPEDLIEGAEGSGETWVTGQTRAVDRYRTDGPSAGGLTTNQTGGN